MFIFNSDIPNSFDYDETMVSIFKYSCEGKEKLILFPQVDFFASKKLQSNTILELQIVKG